MRGVTAKSPEMIARAQALRAEGMLVREIAVALGVARSTAHAWLTDPDGARLAARKDGYRGACEDCGAPTDGSAGPGLSPAYCKVCIVAHRETKWDTERCIEAIQWWAAKFGEAPGVADFNPYQARALGDEARAVRGEALVLAGRIPTHATVYRWCGSWSEAVEAAGFTARPSHGGGGNASRRRSQRMKVAA